MWVRSRGKKEDKVVTTGGGGHYEVVVAANTTPRAQHPWTGFFNSTAQPEAYTHLHSLGQRIIAGLNNARSSASMAADHDASAKVHTFNLLDAVAVRVPGRKRRSGDGLNSLPGLVVGIHEHDQGQQSQKVVHKLYTVWCAYGVLAGKLSVDMLNKLTINNFPHLLNFRDKKLSDSERLASSDPDWLSPLNGTLRKCTRIPLKDAWEKHRLSYTQRTQKMGRNRNTVTRPAADAAGTAIAAGQVDRNSALSLSTVTSQPASQPARSTSPSRIVEIVGHTSSKYKVVYSQPKGNPERGEVTRKWLDKQADHIDLVVSYWGQSEFTAATSASEAQIEEGWQDETMEDVNEDEDEVVDMDPIEEMEEEEDGEWVDEVDDIVNEIDEE